MKTLNQYLVEAKTSQHVMGHFNFADSVTFNAIVAVAKKLGVAVMLGTSEGERNLLPLATAVAMVRGVREATGLPIFLNADHSKSMETFKTAVDAGYDSVHFDGSELSYAENLRLTKEAVAYARAKNPDISVEGELGYIAGSSQVHKQAVEVRPEFYTQPEQAAEFAVATGIDRLAVVIGNIHGVSLAGNPRLDIERLKSIGGSVPPLVSLTLHGGSGIPDHEIKAALPHGLSNIHVNTEIRVAYETALRDFFVSHPNETTPYKFFAPTIAAVEKLIEQKLKLFGN